MKDYIKIGIEQNLISFSEDMSRIIYVFQKKERNYNNPEEESTGRNISSTNIGL
ncbi:hypothetical protein H8744_12865 [Oscillospiraceae bacterium N12]|jgi:hypothetical protein|uniref:Uncharacterized protein n=1 Tax=Jilunia laotingensis TaxID=2763675 RepID=A0A926F1U6_9BACT|nr:MULTISPECIES: hypothetical protein [Bacteroidaceae]MBC8594123.1 hypothetical protein [Jilunia laotingensis]